MARTRRARRAKTSKSDNPATESGEANGASEATGGRAPSKVAAVREALAQGADSPELGVAFILDRFGIEIGRQHFSAIKSRLKKEAGEAPRRRGRPRKVAVAVIQRTGGAPARRVELLTDLEAVKRLVAQHGADTVKRMVDLLG
jgi:hypothetical protein